MNNSNEIVSIEVHLANRLLESMNEKVFWVAPQKKESVQTVMFAVAYEILAAFNIVPTFELVNLTVDKKLKSFKLFDTNPNTSGYFSNRTIPYPRHTTTPQYLKERIIAACLKKEILTLLTEDAATLVPIMADLIHIIEQFQTRADNQILNHWRKEEDSILIDDIVSILDTRHIKIMDFLDYGKKQKNHMQISDYSFQKYSHNKSEIIHYNFFKIDHSKLLYQDFAHQNQNNIMDLLARACPKFSDLQPNFAISLNIYSF